MPQIPHWTALLSAFGLFSMSAIAQAKPKVEIQISEAKEVVTKAGTAVTTKWVPTTTAVSGDTLQYTLAYTNKGDEKATDAVIVDPVPKGTVYLGNSATGENSEISFSSDGGKTFAPAVKLTYEMKSADGKTEKRVATPSQYTHIRWVVKEVPPGASGQVAFVVKVL